MRGGLAVLALLACGCGERAAAPALNAALELSPSPPRVGVAQVRVALADGARQPLAGASVELEGNMNHAGMRPTFAKLAETAPGRYEGTLELTMGGDWIVRISARTAGGALETQVPVNGVRP